MVAIVDAYRKDDVFGRVFGMCVFGDDSGDVVDESSAKADGLKRRVLQFRQIAVTDENSVGFESRKRPVCGGFVVSVEVKQ